MTYSRHVYLKWGRAAVAIKVGNELVDCEKSLIPKEAAKNFQTLTFSTWSLRHVMTQLEMNQQKLWDLHLLDEIISQALFALATSLEGETKDNKLNQPLFPVGPRLKDSKR